MNIPINIETLLTGKVVESERIEYKKSWNPPAIMRTVAAFANDFENLGSGYIVVGVEEENGLPVRPVYGFPPEQFDKVQKEMIGYCNLIRPPYFPRLSLEEIDGKHVLLIWVTAGSHRPYEVPRDVKAKSKDYSYYIRKFASTVQANGEQKQELISLTANVPFDDRINSQASLNDISPSLLRQHLLEINSKILEAIPTPSNIDLCRQMNLTEGADEHIYPKNVGLLMFNEHPEKIFPATQINLVQFPDGVEGAEFYEKTFHGSIQNQLRDALKYIKVQIIKAKVVKVQWQAESVTYFNYPFAAIEEALANAVYHKNYEIREPIEVRVLPESIEIISFGGSDPSIRMEDLNKGIIRARRYRNRRIGEFLKELKLTEGKGTGLPTIRKALQDNGSPPAKYDTDGNDRRYFITELLIHDEFKVHDGAHDKDYDRDYDRDPVKPKIAHVNAKITHVKSILGDEVKNRVINRIIQTLEYCKEPKLRNEILENIELTNESINFKNNIAPAIHAGLIAMLFPDKPKSRNQKYITTEKGKEIISKQ